MFIPDILFLMIRTSIVVGNINIRIYVFHIYYICRRHIFNWNEINTDST